MPLADLLALILRELDGALVQTGDPAGLARRQAGAGGPTAPPAILTLQVSELDLDLPAHLQVQTQPGAPGSARLTVILPSTLEQPPAGRVGRIRLTIAPDYSPIEAV